MDKIIKRKRVAYLLTFITLLGGILAIFLSIEGHLRLAASLFIIASLIDLIDGKICQKIGPEGNLERELEILSSLISFGVLPSIIIYQAIIRYGSDISILKLILPVIYLLCVTYRLARHNLLKIKDHYVGIPSSVAGGLMIFSILMFKETYQTGIIIATLLVSALMVATFKFPRIYK